MIAGTQSGVGKTTLATGLMAAMSRREYIVQPYKVGPDYIDPGFHTVATGKISRNLDSWMVSKKHLLELFQHSSQQAQISIIEGVMGLFDGHRQGGGRGSSAEVAKILSTPVILIIDAQQMAQSGAALTYGFQNYDPDLNLVGVILNRVSSKSHYRMIKEPIEELGVAVLGHIPQQEELELPERHLGLVPTAESNSLVEYLDELAASIEEHLDLDKIYQLAAQAEELDLVEEELFAVSENEAEISIAVARDKAFNFYYEDNLDLLRARGVKIKYFSPLQDNSLPPGISGIYIGGGFPESFLKELSENKSIQRSLKVAISQGMPTYAECGGLMYLTKKIVNFDQESYPMLGIIPGSIVMQDSLQAMGYVEATVETDNILLPAGAKIRGHEFHYSRLLNLSNKLDSAYSLKGGKGEDGRWEGFVKDNLLASYLHLHFASNSTVIDNFIEACQKFKQGSS